MFLLGYVVFKQILIRAWFQLGHSVFNPGNVAHKTIEHRRDMNMQTGNMQ